MVARTEQDCQETPKGRINCNFTVVWGQNGCLTGQENAL